MAGGCACSVYIFAFMLSLLFGTSTSYIEYTLENSKVCSQIRKRELKLGERENSAIYLKEQRYFDNWSGAFPFNCEFTVLAPSGHRIAAVIENLDFRINESSKECIDFVQFQRPKKLALWRFDTYTKSQKYCGIVNSTPGIVNSIPYALDSAFIEQSHYANNAFVDESGHLDVMISVAGQRLLPSQNLDIKIVFTAFKNCLLKPEAGFKPCKEDKEDRDVCIWEGFFYDKVVNCPFYDCYDEGGCPVLSPGKKHSSGLGTKVTIGAVVLILGLLLLFMLCLFVCRRCRILCWSSPPAPRPQRPSQQSGRVEMTTAVNNAVASAGESEPSAPPLLSVTSAASPVLDDKDLPPPYESLFPLK